MEFISTKINHLVIAPTKTSQSLGKTFTSKFSAEKEKRFGKIFGLIVIESNDPQAEEFIECIIENIKTHYSQGADLANAEPGMVLDIEKRFEAALQKTNFSIAEFLEKNKLSIELKNIHAIIGVIKEKIICFTATGEVSAHLIHYKKKNDYSIINIYDYSPADETEMNPLKFFSQTIGGKIDRNDFLYFSTSNVLDYLSLEKIKSIVTQDTIANALFHFKSTLTSIDNGRQYIITIINLLGVLRAKEAPPSERIKTFDYTQAASKDSIHQLEQTKRATEKFLHPSALTNFNRGAQALRRTMRQYASNIKNTTFNKLPRPAEKSALREYRQAVPAHTDTLLRRLAAYGHKLLVRLGRSFGYLPKKTKIAALLFMVVLTLLGFNLFNHFVLNRTSQKVAAIDAIVLHIQSLKDAAEASLIYQDEDMARIKFLEAKRAIDEVPLAHSNDPRVLEIKKVIDDQLRLLRYSTLLTDIVPIGNWQNLDDNAVIAPHLTLWNDAVYTQNLSNQLIYKLNINSHILTSVFASNNESGTFKLAAVLNNEVFFVNQEQALFAFNPIDDTLTPVDFNLEPGAQIAAMVGYNNRLYVLDTAHNQIYRYQRTSAGLGGAESWLTDDLIDVTDAVDMAIDGNIFVLKKNGSVIKIAKGKLSEFSLKTIYPALEHPTKIQTNDRLENIYILDSTNNRIVQVNKEGYLIQQYESPEFTQLLDIVVFEREKRVYVLNGTQVLGAPIQ